MSLNGNRLKAYVRMKLHYSPGYRPHLVPAAVAFIDSKINKRSRVMEIGSGSSTIWFARRAEKVISYENVRLYYDMVKTILDQHGIKNVELHFKPTYPAEGIIGDKESFDFILIDGRGRVKNSRACISLLKPGGYFILDDSNRKQYHQVRSLLKSKGWPHFDFSIEEDNPCNFIPMTTIWKKQ